MKTKHRRLWTLGAQAPGVVLIVLSWVMLAGCSVHRQGGRTVSAPPQPQVVTADIQTGIERHIAEQTQLGSGHFLLSFGDKTLRLKLVRVHTEYLASLGPGSHFACVDMVDAGGDVYDVDFFLEGEPGAMVVTETIPHKLNGKPFYFWKQKKDKTWIRVPVTDASRELMGLIVPRDEFEFGYRVTLPVIAGPAKLWVPLAGSDAFQQVEVLALDASASPRVLEGEAHGNRVLFWELDDRDSQKTVNIRYRVIRVEKAAYADGSEDPRGYLNPERLVPADSRFQEIAQNVVAGKTGDPARARALYDHVMEDMRYMKYGDGWGKGDAVYACDALTGNCTDFHAYFIALARSIGIPARFAVGAAIPSERNEGGIDGYHCWVEFHAEGKWWPVDISEANKMPSLAAYYFGNQPANRFEFSRGRDIEVEPGPASGPINFLAYPILEIEEEPAQAKVEFSFRRTTRE